MTKEDLAAILNGREYTNEITEAEEKAAKDEGLLVIFGASDDLMEFRGAWEDECGLCSAYLNRDGLLLEHEDRCYCNYCGFSVAQKAAALVEAIWGDEDHPLWYYKTDIPHATFDIMEDEGIYCRGLVIDINDLPEGVK